MSVAANFLMHHQMKTHEKDIVKQSRIKFLTSYLESSISEVTQKRIYLTHPTWID